MKCKFFSKEDMYLVAGGSSGIGRVIATSLLSAGCKVIVIDKIEFPKFLSTSLTKNLIFIKHNFKNNYDLEQKINYYTPKKNKYSGFVFSVGLSNIEPISLISRDRTIELFEINTYSTIKLTQILTQKNFAKKNMSNVFISSVYSIKAGIYNSVYSMTKSSINSFVKSSALEFSKKKIRFNSVAPGYVISPMLRQLEKKIGKYQMIDIEKKHPLRFGKKKNISEIVLFLLSDSSSWITGQTIVVDGGYSI